MDPRRLLIPAIAGLGLTGCALLDDGSAAPATTPGVLAVAATTSAVLADPPEELAPVVIANGDGPSLMSPPEPVMEPERNTAVAYRAMASVGPAAPARAGLGAVAAANLEARASSASDSFIGGVQVFAWSPGRVYEVRTAPLRVTTLTLGAGETLEARAAGDTLRWQIGEASSGEGAARRTHVLIKPLERGLQTNLVLTTSRRVYFLELRSGGVESFHTAVAWDGGALEAAPAAAPIAVEPVRGADPVVSPTGPLDVRYAIEPQGRRPRWTPASVFNDGQRTFIAFGDDMQTDEAPALFLIAADGEAQLVNYRQAGGLFIVDRLFDRAELRLGDRRPRIVRIRRLQGEGR
ncbi:MAG: TrbG/VirB9 family P-type conjugative transfer protein [Brevundimonas sp.]|nr:TrbG/VirB9 family P-type conjugative transfer protein [Brevundimonas sp.]